MKIKEEICPICGETNYIKISGTELIENLVCKHFTGATISTKFIKGGTALVTTVKMDFNYTHEEQKLYILYKAIKDLIVIKDVDYCPVCGEHLPNHKHNCFLKELDCTFKLVNERSKHV